MSLPKWLSVLVLISAAARSEQVTVAASRAGFGLRNNVFSWAFSEIHSALVRLVTLLLCPIPTLSALYFPP